MPSCVHHGVDAQLGLHTVHGTIGEREELTLGHEAIGMVDEVGELVTRFK